MNSFNLVFLGYIFLIYLFFICAYILCINIKILNKILLIFLVIFGLSFNICFNVFNFTFIFQVLDLISNESEEGNKYQKIEKGENLILKLINDANKEFLSNSEEYDLVNYYNPYDIRYENLIISSDMTEEQKNQRLESLNLTDEQKEILLEIHNTGLESIDFSNKEQNTFIKFDINSGKLYEININDFKPFLKLESNNFKDSFKFKIVIYEIKGYISFGDETTEVFRINFKKDIDNNYFIDKNLGQYNEFSKYINEEKLFEYIETTYKTYEEKYKKIRNIGYKVNFNDYVNDEDYKDLLKLDLYVIFKNHLENKPLEYENYITELDKQNIDNLLKYYYYDPTRYDEKQLQEINYYENYSKIVRFSKYIIENHINNNQYIRDFSKNDKLDLEQIDYLKYVVETLNGKPEHNVMRVYNGGLIFNGLGSKFKYNFNSDEITAVYINFGEYPYNNYEAYKKYIPDDNIVNFEITICDGEIRINYDIIDTNTFDIIESKSFITYLHKMKIKSKYYENLIELIENYTSNKKYLGKEIDKYIGNLKEEYYEKYEKN